MREFYQNQVASLSETLQKTEQELYASAYGDRDEEWEKLSAQNKRLVDELSTFQEEVTFL